MIYKIVVLSFLKIFFYSVVKVRLSWLKFLKGMNLTTGNITRFAIYFPIV